MSSGVAFVFISIIRLDLNISGKVTIDSRNRLKKWVKKLIRNSISNNSFVRRGALFAGRCSLEMDVLGDAGIDVPEIRDKTDMLLTSIEACQIFRTVKTVGKIEGDIAEVGTYMTCVCYPGRPGLVNPVRHPPGQALAGMTGYPETTCHHFYAKSKVFVFGKSHYSEAAHEIT